MKTIIKTLCCFSLLAAQVHAATFVVTDLTDSGPGSLRQAILDANVTAGDDTIEFSTNGTITLSTNLPTITDNTTITGPGTNLLTISGSNTFRVFSMSSGTTNVLSALTIADGKSFGQLVTPPGGGKPTNSIVYASGISNAGSLRLTNCLIRNCTNDSSYGAGVYNAGALELEACVVAGCGSTSYDPKVKGGGIYNDGSLRMKDCIISRCYIFGGGSLGGAIYNTGSMILTNTLIDRCSASGQGDAGGIYNTGKATIHTSVIQNCYGWYGGGINSRGTLFVTNTTLAGNLAHDIGGGAALFFGTNVFSGCTIYSNVCDYAGSGIFNGGYLTMLNCTVSRNRFSFYTGYVGAGIADKSYYNWAGTTYLNHCTVVSNYNASGEISAQGTFSAENSILGDCKGTLISGGHNLISNTNGCSLNGNTTGNLINVDPQLGPLQNNGGPTLTHALLLTSPAIDNADAGGLLTDQRGFARPTNPLASDIGAVEIVLPTLQIALTGTNAVLISWPSPSTDFVLEENPDVATANWSDVGTTPSDNGTTKSVVVPASAGNRFFRLRKP